MTQVLLTVNMRYMHFTNIKHKHSVHAHTVTRNVIIHSHLSKCDHIHSSARGMIISEMVGYDLKRAIRDVKT